MISLAPKPSVIAYNKRLKPLKQKRLPERKAVTIGIGFHCTDGIVLCSDTQVTWEQFHKYYEHKITHHGEEGKWTVAFTYSGNPAVARMFDEKFQETLALVGAKTPLDASTIQRAIETTLCLIDVLDNNPNALCLLCGIVIDNKEMRLVHTEGKIVSKVDSHHFIGAGDSSVLRYLVPTLTMHSDQFTAWRAIHVGIYLTCQAKRYVDGCGGDTDVLTITPKGRIRLTNYYNIEQNLLRLEFLMDRAATGLFDLTMPDEEFNDHLDRFVKAVKEERQELKAKPIFK